MGVSDVLTAIGWIVGPLVTALVAALIAQHRKLKEARERAARSETDLQLAINTILKALARDYIKDAYQKYVIEGHKMTIAAYEELLEVYEAYKAMGGNGTAKAYMKELMALKPYLVTE